MSTTNTTNTNNLFWYRTIELSNGLPPIPIATVVPNYPICRGRTITTVEQPISLMPIPTRDLATTRTFTSTDTIVRNRNYSTSRTTAPTCTQTQECRHRESLCCRNPNRWSRAREVAATARWSLRPCLPFGRAVAPANRSYRPTSTNETREPPYRGRSIEREGCR